MSEYDFGPAPGAFTVGGMGGPGSGMATVQGQPDMLQGFREWLGYMGAGGFGMGPYGYPLAYGLSPWGQQNHLLNRQWGWNGLGNHNYGFGGAPQNNPRYQAIR